MVSQQRPSIAIITNSCPPYRLHFHRRIAKEIPQVQLYSVFTHQISDAAWVYNPPSEIGPVMFGKDQAVTRQGDPRHAMDEWQKGGRIIDWMLEQQVRGVVIGGYNDPGRLRIIRFCRQRRIPCLLQADSNIRDDSATGLRAWAKVQFVGHIVRYCNAFLVCGELGKEYFVRYGARPGQIFFSPYEPDYSLIREVSDSTLASARTKFALPSPPRRLLTYSGRLVPVKRVDLLIDAFAQMATQRKDWDLLLIGDGPLREMLQQRVPPELRSRVHWTGFLDDQALVSALYRLSDVLVLPSDREPWAVVINEAAAAGLAIVASDVVGAAAELVRDGVNGRIFLRGNIDQLVASLLDVTDPNRIDAMKSASAGVLEDWRRKADPVKGLETALRWTGVID